MKLLDWLIKRRDDKLTEQFGGTQTCPWCRQCAQSGPNPWHFRVWDADPFLDVLTCSVCTGTSLWRFEFGMGYIGALDPPKPAWDDNPNYDIKTARLRHRFGNVIKEIDGECA